MASKPTTETQISFQIRKKPSTKSKRVRKVHFTLGKHNLWLSHQRLINCMEKDYIVHWPTWKESIQDNLKKDLTLLVSAEDQAVERAQLPNSSGTRSHMQPFCRWFTSISRSEETWEEGPELIPSWRMKANQIHKLSRRYTRSIKRATLIPLMPLTGNFWTKVSKHWKMVIHSTNHSMMLKLWSDLQALNILSQAL